MDDNVSLFAVPVNIWVVYALFGVDHGLTFKQLDSSPIFCIFLHMATYMLALISVMTAYLVVNETLSNWAKPRGGEK